MNKGDFEYDACQMRLGSADVVFLEVRGEVEGVLISSPEMIWAFTIDFRARWTCPAAAGARNIAWSCLLYYLSRMPNSLEDCEEQFRKLGGVIDKRPRWMPSFIDIDSV